MGFGDWLEDKIIEGIEEAEEKLDDLERTINDPIGSTEERIKKFLGVYLIEKKKKIKKRGLQKGDVVGVRRAVGTYDHYGVYIGNKRIIHYTSESGDIDGSNEILETSFSRFLRDSNSYFILAFPDEYDKPEKVNFSTAYRENISLPDIDILMKKLDYKLYSSSETVKRAKSKLGEQKYNLVFNNCEHFAIWCKTGIKESHQVNKVLDILSYKEKFNV